MKKLLLLPFSIVSLSAYSSPYIGLEYGAAFINTDYEETVNGKQLKPEADGGAFGAFIGYQFNSSWGLELGYRQFDLSDAISYETETVLIEDEYEWNADINAKQVTLMPVYFYQMNDKWQVKAGAGLTYTQYDFDASYQHQQEDKLTDIDTVLDYQKGESGSEKKWGGVLSVGIEYEVITNLALGLSAKYQADSFADNSSINFTTAYYF